MAFNWIPLAASALGIGGGMLMGGEDENTKRLRAMLEQQAREGAGVGKLAAPGVGGVNVAYADAMRSANTRAAASGLSGTSLANVQGADLFERRAGGLGDVYAQATAQNEAIKARAQSQLLGLAGMTSSQQNAAQQAMGSLTGAGIQGMLRGFMNMGNTTPLSFDQAYVDPNFKVPKSQMQLPNQWGF